MRKSLTELELNGAEKKIRAIDGGRMRAIFPRAVSKKESFTETLQRLISLLLFIAPIGSNKNKTNSITGIS